MSLNAMPPIRILPLPWNTRGIYPKQFVPIWVHFRISILDPGLGGIVCLHVRGRVAFRMFPGPRIFLGLMMNRVAPIPLYCQMTPPWQVPMCPPCPLEPIFRTNDEQGGPNTTLLSNGTPDVPTMSTGTYY